MPLWQFLRPPSPVADFVQATFDPVSANGANPYLILAANGIQMADPLWREKRRGCGVVDFVTGRSKGGARRRRPRLENVKS
jgi:hypothetical protein